MYIEVLLCKIVIKLIKLFLRKKLKKLKKNLKTLITVKPVYNGHPWDPPKVAVDSLLL